MTILTSNQIRFMPAIALIVFACAFSLTASTAVAETIAPANFGIVAQDAYWHWSQEADAPMLLDVRTVEEFADGHIPGAKLIPHDQLASRLTDVKISKNEPLVVYCRSGRRAGLAVETLAAAGFKQIFLLEGHWNSWSTSGQPIEK